MDLGALRPGGGRGQGGDDIVKDSSTAGFAKDVLEASREALVLVDFWAAWCGPCKQLTPILEKVVRSYAGKVRLVKINTDEHSAIAAQLRVQSLPTVYAFRDGRPLDGFMGAQPESTVRAFIDRLLGRRGRGRSRRRDRGGGGGARSGRSAERGRGVCRRSAGGPAERAGARRSRALLSEERRHGPRRADAGTRASRQEDDRRRAERESRARSCQDGRQVRQSR